MRQSRRPMDGLQIFLSKTRCPNCWISNLARAASNSDDPEMELDEEDELPRQD